MQFNCIAETVHARHKKDNPCWLENSFWPAFLKLLHDVFLVVTENDTFPRLPVGVLLVTFLERTNKATCMTRLIQKIAWMIYTHFSSLYLI